MKIIVTGAAGLIGSATIHYLNLQGEFDILAVDHLGTSEKWKNLRALKFNDYIEKDKFLTILEGKNNFFDTDAIIHLGACSSTTELDASYLVHNNFEYTKTLATYSVTNKIRFLYASSAATYGNGSQGYHDDENHIETLCPLNMYGYSKQLFDLWAKRHNLLNKIAGMKFTNVYGPNEAHKGAMRSMVCRAYEQICSTGEVSLFRSYCPQYADGEQMRDFIYVKDAVKMICFLLGNPELNGLFNIGSGYPETWNHLAKSVFYALQKEPKIKYIDMPPQLINKYQYFTCADMNKMFNAGYTEKLMTLEDAIKDYVINYLIPNRHLGEEK